MMSDFQVQEKIRRIDSLLKSELDSENFVIAFAPKDGRIFTHITGQLPLLMMLSVFIGKEIAGIIERQTQQPQQQPEVTQ